MGYKVSRHRRMTTKEFFIKQTFLILAPYEYKKTHAQ